MARQWRNCAARFHFDKCSGLGPVPGHRYRFTITGETNQKLVLLPPSYNYFPVLFHRRYCFQSYCGNTSSR